MSSRYFIVGDPESIDANIGKQHGLPEGTQPRDACAPNTIWHPWLPVPDQRTPINQRVILQQNSSSRKERCHCRSPRTHAQRRKKHDQGITILHFARPMRIHACARHRNKKVSARGCLAEPSSHEFRAPLSINSIR
jgi:hypothetical protein